MYHCIYSGLIHYIVLLNVIVSGQELIASLSYGTFQGSYSSRYNISFWRKIPFAAPPIGENRFRAPQPPVSITNGTYNSDQSFDSCPQRNVSFPSPEIEIQSLIEPGQWLRRLPLLGSLLQTMDFVSVLASCSRRFLWWRVHPRWWFFHYSTRRISCAERIYRE